MTLTQMGKYWSVSTSHDNMFVLSGLQYKALLSGTSVPESDVGISITGENFECNSPSGIVLLDDSSLNMLV